LKQRPDQSLDCAVISRLMWRLMPFLFLLYIVAYLDRINVSFAILQMRGQLHLGDRVYGRAAGMFFAGYFFFQVPSSLVLEKMGVRRWISGLMVIWGLVGCSMIFIHGPVSFYTLRFLLGAAEAGFFPGMILYLKQWFPVGARGRAVAWFMTANPLAGVVGSPISGALLGMHGGGLAGWQWLFLMEGLPAIVLGSAVYWVLADGPKEAKWLAEEQRGWLLGELERERLANLGDESDGVWKVLASGRIWLLGVAYFGVPACMYGVSLWLPSAIRSVSQLGYWAIGTLAAVPYFVTAVAMVLVGMHSDSTGERRWHTALPGFAGAAALVAAACGRTYGGKPALLIVGMSVGMLSAQAMSGPFWAMATSGLSGTAASVSIAVVNSIGNLGGYFGPYIIGLARSDNGEFKGGLLAIAATLATCAGIALLVGAKRYGGNEEAAKIREN
jgi:ACS family tartrate transporter-like MFS transporter